MIYFYFKFCYTKSVIAYVDTILVDYVIYVKHAKLLFFPAFSPDSVDYNKQIYPLKHY